MATNVQHTTAISTENLAHKAIQVTYPLKSVKLWQNNVLPNPSHTVHAIQEGQLNYQ